MVVLDTCALINLCLSKCSIGTSVIKLIDKGSIILSISFAEIACKIKIGKLDIGMTSEDLLNHYRMIPRVQIVDISPEMWHKSISLDWEHGDPADRLIVSFASEFGHKIVTTYRIIKNYHKNVIWEKVT